LFSAVGYGSIGARERAELEIYRSWEVLRRNATGVAAAAVGGFAGYRVGRWARRSPAPSAALAQHIALAGGSAGPDAAWAGHGPGPAPRRGGGGASGARAGNGTGPAPRAGGAGGPAAGRVTRPAQRPGPGSEGAVRRRGRPARPVRPRGRPTEEARRPAPGR